MCRFCGTPLHHSFINLDMSPLANAYLRENQLLRMEPFYPLQLYVCEQCFLVQLDEFESPAQIFSDYAYFSSYSQTWLEHARQYSVEIMYRLQLDKHSKVVEIASNDGYLLQNFVQWEIPVLGIEPAANVAEVAIKKGIPTLSKFFGTDLARELVADGVQADLLVGNNVLAHVPRLNDFVAGMKLLLKPNGVITMEFPHLLHLIKQRQFDTIYHEHFSYFSLITVERVFAHHGLTIFDVDQIPTHGGSLRIYACHTESQAHPVNPRVKALRDIEVFEGFTNLQYYAAFTEAVKQIKADLLMFLIEARRQGKTVVGYGAPAKGNTLLNYCGVGQDFIEYVVDRNPYKQGLYLPGTHIPIRHPSAIPATRPDYLLILPWNLKDEIMQQEAHILEWGGRFVIPIPSVQVVPQHDDQLTITPISSPVGSIQVVAKRDDQLTIRATGSPVEADLAV
jgi:2-polyprenyl-3-methyl-5-hydroxy-6-metoxy-1,4-benzoquinol methylase